jgi:hypothetical protein
MTPVKFDLMMARKYKHKVDNAATRGIEFTLTFAQMRSIYTRTRCAYTGRPLTVSCEQPQPPTDLTLERIDSTKGYVPGNCIAVCAVANNIKGIFEDPNTPLNVDDAINMFANISKMMQKAA